MEATAHSYTLIYSSLSSMGNSEYSRISQTPSLPFTSFEQLTFGCRPQLLFLSHSSCY